MLTIQELGEDSLCMTHVLNHFITVLAVNGAFYLLFVIASGGLACYSELINYGVLHR